jgi:hypothetical protein
MGRKKGMSLHPKRIVWEAFFIFICVKCFESLRRRGESLEGERKTRRKTFRGNEKD